MKYLIPLLVAIGAIANVHGEQETIYRRDVEFDPNYGGLHSKVIFSRSKASPETTPLQLDVMLSTVHSRTFVVDKDCDTDATGVSNFCATHKDGGYDTKKTGTTREGNVLELTSEDLKGAGHSVVDTILIADGTTLGSGLLVLNQKFGVLNGKMEQDPRFWGIQREKDGEKKVIKDNLAKGCLSLQLGDLDTEAAKDFGATPPLQTFVKEDTLKQQILSIQMEKTEKGIEAKAKGTMMFGALAVDDQCHSWSSIKPSAGDQQAWTVKIDGLEGVEAAKGTMAILDTTSDKITLPKSVWEAMNNGVLKGKENECAVDKLPILKFTIDKMVYSVPAAHYVDVEKDSKCAHFLAENADEKDDKIHLGLPFLRSTCIGMDMKTKTLYLSGAKCQQGGTDTGGGNGAANAVFSTLSFLFGFVALVAPALMII